MMKNSLLSILLVLLALPCVAQSNRIYMDDFEIMPDSTVVMPVILANESPSRGLQFDVTLPEGLTKTQHVLTDHSREYDMNLSCQRIGENKYQVMIYPSSRICYPVDTTAVMTFTFKAKPDFKGGDILFINCMGSTIDNKVFPVQGDTIHVTVPASSLIGIPIDQQPTRDRYYNLQGQPISTPAGVPVAICVTTRSDGKTVSRKLAVKP